VRATVLDPDNAEAQLRLADLLFTQGRIKNAESIVRRLLDVHPFNEGAVKLLNNLFDRSRNGNSEDHRPFRPSYQVGGDSAGRCPPKVSILTPSFNCQRFIRDCIESVLAQNYTNFEHIIVDGASRDGTVEILREYPHLRWISEPDGGEGEALNKALRMATGDIIGWLNADDCYEKAILPGVVEEMTSFGGADIVYGKTIFVDDNGNPTHWVMPAVPINLVTLTRWFNLNLFQPSIFFSRKLFETVGFFREDLQYGIDYEYWFRIASKGFQFRYVDQVLSRAMIYRSGGKTLTPYAVKAQEWLEICYSYQRFLTYGERLHFWKDYFIFRLRNADTCYENVPLTLPDRIEAFIGLLMAEKEVAGINPEHLHQRIASNPMVDKADALGFLGEALRNAGNEAEAAKAFEWAIELNASELLGPSK
jgi:glycosyltransferase involved in cell wall biosynthesis